MKLIQLHSSFIDIHIPKKTVLGVRIFTQRFLFQILFIVLCIIAVILFYIYYRNGLGLSYNDARSHLDIGRRVVEGLKPGIAQLGSVWLPMNHILMIPTVWNDYMWHSGLSGALESMIGFVVTALVIYEYLKKLGVGILGRLAGVGIFVTNLNILYLQSTAMTELLLIATMSLGAYELLLWHEDDDVLHLIKAAFWIMISTLTRYDGWFLLAFAAVLVVIQVARKKNYHVAEGTIVLFLTLGMAGIVSWFVWNQLIFKDALYFIFGPFSAHSQQEQLRKAGVLITHGNLWLSVKIYLFALLYNSYTYPAIIAAVGAILLWFDKKLPLPVRISTTVLLGPLFFNILALYLGFSVLFIQGLTGATWFNVRYGVMLVPTIAIFTGYLIDRARGFRLLIIGTLLFVIFFGMVNHDAVTIDDARVGSSQKNVSQISGVLSARAGNQKGYILISAASHDAIIFSSGIPMSRFIHEGTGAYWTSALTSPDRWARWIVMRSYDDNDLTWKNVSKSPGFFKFKKVASYPFADLYELDARYVSQLHTSPVLGKLK